MFTLRVMVIKMSKMADFYIFCWRQQKISHILGKIYKCIWKILLSSFRKWYGLCALELNSLLSVEVSKNYWVSKKLHIISTKYKKNDTFSHTHWAVSICVFYFCILRPSKYNSWDPPLHFVFARKIHIYIPPLHYFSVCKTHIYMPKITLSSLLS